MRLYRRWFAKVTYHQEHRRIWQGQLALLQSVWWFLVLWISAKTSTHDGGKGLVVVIVLVVVVIQLVLVWLGWDLNPTPPAFEVDILTTKPSLPCFPYSHNISCNQHPPCNNLSCHHISPHLSDNIVLLSLWPSVQHPTKVVIASRLQWTAFTLSCVFVFRTMSHGPIMDFFKPMSNQLNK